VGPSSGTGSFTFSGVVNAEFETNLSFKVGGTLNQVSVRLGDRVRQGQLIASIDPADYNVQMEQAVAQEKSAESQLVTARSTFERVEKLYVNNSVSLSEYEKAKANLASAESQYNASNKQLEAARNQVSYTQLYAPMDGIITSLMVESNEIVNAGRVIAMISSEGNLEIEVGVPEAAINKLEKGQDVSIEFPSIQGEPFEGKVERIAFASGQSPTYPITVRILNATNEIRPGMAADVRFMTKSEETSQGVIAPIAALAKDADGHFVYVLQKETDSVYIIEKRKVMVGDLLTDGFEILDGLEENELVATAGLSFLRDEMKVSLLE
jgi:RND family efflux transporter MFP subunit